MSEQPKETTPAAFAPAGGLGALVEFVEGKLIGAFGELKAREQMEQTWRGGTDEMWRAVGCTKTKRQRLREADIHRHIAEKKRKEVEMFNAVLERLKAPNAAMSDADKKP